MKTVVVVGGGITGLCTMHYLQKQKKEKNLDIRLVLVEKNEFLGGKIHSEHDQGFIMETGADSIVARHQSVMPLVQELGLENDLVYNGTGISYIYTNNTLHAIPADSVFGIPTSIESLNSSTLVSPQGKKEALKDLELPNDRFTKDSSIGEFLEYFLGKELVEKQIAPVLSGVYSGDLYKLTMASTLPYLLDYKEQYGSIIKGFGANREQFQKSANKKFISFKNGLSQLIDRLAETLTDVEFIKGVATTNIEKQGEQYICSFDKHEDIVADFVVLSTPHAVTSEILKDKAIDQDLNTIHNASIIAVYVGFDIPDENLPADGTGYIVSENNDVKCNACTWTSRKWKHTSESGNLLIRVFYKSANPLFKDLKHLSEEEITAIVLDDIKKSLKLNGKPTVVNITKWNDLMPIYGMEHATMVKSLNAQLEEKYPNVLLAGCSYYGVGIGSCIQNGQDTAQKIASQLV
ncbi:protoporphyrinogen oxidase [Rummeliibacillus suwonensis]|uniref:protoporphyrinogen oxidase n=1 Tax=Rummeliibacillus suwonensis TaxID=1306154 RepID=UPI001AAFC908|nr:protoporphyrinogen oxidase [Rummeliibacillus suwonensis]MBO2537185.1 protoporphyrinogen oxidase [Rummeliibacillus suwonensis]